jgi:hypothetical protein
MGRTEDSAMIILLFSFIGIILCLMENYLYANNIILNAVVDADVTLYAIMTMTVVISELIGVIVVASR